MATEKSPETGQRTGLLEKMHSTIQTLSWESHKQSTETMKELDLTLPQGVVLLTLFSRGNRAKMSELIELIQISGGTLTGIVDRLITAGLVARERDEVDRRVVYVSLTEAGALKVQAVQHANRTKLNLALAGFSNQELEQFIALLRKFVAAANGSPEALPDYPDLLKSYELTLAGNLPSSNPGQARVGSMSEKDLPGRSLANKEKSYD